MRHTRYSVSQRHQLPHAVGVYQFYDHKGVLLYVGKAKSLKKRVENYFTAQDAHHIKTRKMVAQIHTIGAVLVNSESEALLLENNLIKAHQPRYNMLLKDDKSFPYLCIVDERFPRLILTRQSTPSLGRYFGPFTDGGKRKTLERLIRNLYPIRICTYDLSAKNIAKKKYKVCLAYHLGRCLGPCEGLQQVAAYDKMIEEVVQLLKGNFGAIKKKMKTRMLAAADRLDLDSAQAYKDKAAALEKYEARSLIVHTQWGKLDVVALIAEQAYVFASYLRVHKGMIIFAQTIEIARKLDESEGELATMALLHFRDKAQSEAKQILTNVELPHLPEGLKQHIPQRGEKHKLLLLAEKNAHFFAKAHTQQKKERQSPSRTLLMQLQQDLKLDQVPMHIECFDNSHLDGDSAVAGMVCFKRGAPAKRGYRHYAIKTVAGNDDFAYMREVIHRRYGKEEDQRNLPGLIVIDGGKGQLGAAVGVLQELGLAEKIAVIGIAKRLEEIYKPGDSYPLLLSKKSPSLQLLQRIRNEAHRFAVSYHRIKRDKKSLGTVLQEIKGVGPTLATRLLRTLGSVESIKKASPAQLQEVVGAKKAALIYAHFHAA